MREAKATPRSIAQIRATLAVATCGTLLFLLSIAMNNRAFFHSEDTSWTMHAIGTGDTWAAAQRQYDSSWVFAQNFLRRYDLYALKIRVGKVAAFQTADRKTLGVAYHVNRDVTVYGHDWNRFLHYHETLGLGQPTNAEVYSDSPRSIPTYGEILIAVAFLFMAACAGPLRYTREETEFATGMNPMIIALHICLSGLAIASIWYLSEQPRPSAEAMALIAAGAVLVLGRWGIATRRAWVTVLRGGPSTQAVS